MCPEGLGYVKVVCHSCFLCREVFLSWGKSWHLTLRPEVLLAFGQAQRGAMSDAPHQANPARAARWSSLSTTELKKLPHLAKAAKVTMWHAAWPPICFTCEIVLHLNLAVNNLARMFGKKESSWQPLHYPKSNISPLHHPLAPGIGGDGPWAFLWAVLHWLTQPMGSMVLSKPCWGLGWVSKAVRVSG